MTDLTPLRRIACHAAAMAAAIVVGIASWLLFDRREVVSIQMIPASAVFTPGQMARVEWSVTERRSGCGGEVRRQLIEDGGKGRIHDFPPQPVVYRDRSLNSGVFVREFLVPNSIAPGPAIHRAYAIRWCNMLQRHIWPMTAPPVDTPITIIAP